MKAILTILLLVFSHSANAGLIAFTMHSRANCGNNESISWHAGHSYWLRTLSAHYTEDGESYHTQDTSKEYTWRSAAVDWGEGISGQWIVYGFHYGYDEEDNMIFLDQTFASDCSIYDGWWD